MLKTKVVVEFNWNTKAV